MPSCPSNPQELVGILRAVFDARCLGKLGQQTCYIEVMRHIARNSLHDAVRGLLNVAKSLFDRALSNQYGAQRKKGVSVRAWLEANVDLGSLLMPSEDIQAVLSAEGDWKSVARPIRRLHELRATGEAIFSFAKAMPAGEAFRVILTNGIAELAADNFSVESTTKLRAVCDATTAVLLNQRSMRAKKAAHT